MTKKIKVLELFSGTGYVSNVFRGKGHKAWKVDWSKDLDANLHIDISKLKTKDVTKLCGGKPNVIWASPDCATFSIAATTRGGGLKHRETGTYLPKTEYARFCDKVNRHVINLIVELKPKYWFIENPRGLMRKVPYMVNIGKKLPGAVRYTITYCQYGGKTMKPTDIWTNHPNPKFRLMCNAGDLCHSPAPRGSGSVISNGISWNDISSNGMHSMSIMRGIMPSRFINHLVRICEG